ncbi:MAG TPA: DMT family transporter [Cellvibrio sp.]|nr:DMT family transporter [Cellvibrio sp.]
MKEVSYALFVLAIGVGISLASQAGINAQLRLALASPIQAAFFSFLVGTLLLGAIMLIQGEALPSWREASAIPWWAWLGGFLGAFNIAMTIYLVPQLGAVALTVSVVCGQLLAALLYDQYGMLGYPKLEISASRMLGAVFLLLGVIMVARK